MLGKPDASSTRNLYPYTSILDPKLTCQLFALLFAYRIERPSCITRSRFAGGDLG